MAGRPWLWATVLGLMVWGLVAASRGTAGIPTPPADPRGGDLQLYEAVTKRVAGGEGYYSVLASELPARGYATRSVFNWRLPTLTWLDSLPPSPRWGQVLFGLLGFTVVVVWTAVIGKRIPRATVATAVVVAITTVPVVLIGNMAYFHEAWAGLLIAASLGCWALDRRGVGIALALAAVLIRELAVPYVLVMAAVAWWDVRRVESAAWLAIVGGFLVGWAWHTRVVLAHMPTEGIQSGWLVFSGWPFVLATAHANVLLMLLPQWAVAVLVPWLWAGGWQWTDPVGRRLALILTGYYSLFIVAGRPDNWYWGFIVAPLLTVAAFGHLYGTAGSRA